MGSKCESATAPSHLLLTSHFRLLTIVFVAVALLSPTATAQQPSLKDVLSRLDKYLLGYEQALASVVAEERYTQIVSNKALAEVYQERVLVSDYALARAPGGQTWTGFRDTFEVNGKPVRDREERLAALLATGTPESSAQARRIAAENARYNIGDAVAARNINVPTVALDLVHPANRSRFSFARSGGETIDGIATWRIIFVERGRPTLIRDHEGRDRLARGALWLDPSSGEVLRTTLQWEGAPAGSITVTYERDANIGALVPMRMVEQYRRDKDGLTVDGEAVYSNYRRFQTSGRIVR